jgi:cell filamentation protein
MRNAYDYVDPDHAYTDPDTGVLRNLADIAAPDALLFFESAAVVKRTGELESQVFVIRDAGALLDIHRYLFQDVYRWAGQKRTVEISKQGKPFFPTVYFDRGFAHIDTLISEYRKVAPAEVSKLAECLAVLLDNINYLHPFREGNGRAQREFSGTAGEYASRVPGSTVGFWVGGSLLSRHSSVSDLFISAKNSSAFLRVSSHISCGVMDLYRSWFHILILRISSTVKFGLISGNGRVLFIGNISY